MIPGFPETLRPRVVCVGMTALDHIWQVESLPERGKTRAEGFASRGGGMAATAAVAVARLGGQAVFLGRAGADEAGHAMRRELFSEDVDVTDMKLVPGAQSSVSCVLVDAAGERQIVNFRGANLPDDPSWLPAARIAEADVVLADPRWPDGAAKAFEIARSSGVPTVLDAEVSDAEIFDRLLPLTDHAIFSESSLLDYAGGDLDRIGATCSLAAVTRGADGVDWISAGTKCHRSAMKVAVVDTNGAGDVFHGAYALALGAGLEIRDAMGFAAAAAALKCTKPGGRSGIPARDETLMTWRQNA
ncbi:sulfofructose kinase [Sagittula marina]|uniref:Sulfofructose kinase n=1 Tax=Sagittula marina TaxID=943940 RepID=A0A7W6GV24_9RHOB|nr:PfkB family carbohydrate kinase [Sagittula marina]MBB3988128.1 sulfofructose kinase [Sagittula marina]